MAEEYRWHTQQIGNVIQTLNNSFQNLTQMKETYEKIPQAVNAENLNIVIEADIKKYEAVLTELDDIIKGLTKASDFYTDGEAGLKSLVDDISVNTAYKG